MSAPGGFNQVGCPCCNGLVKPCTECETELLDVYHIVATWTCCGVEYSGEGDAVWQGGGESGCLWLVESGDLAGFELRVSPTESGIKIPCLCGELNGSISTECDPVGEYTMSNFYPDTGTVTVS